jgi:hypothetical protein
MQKDSQKEDGDDAWDNRDSKSVTVSQCKSRRDGQTHRAEHIKRRQAADTCRVYPFGRLSESVLPRTESHCNPAPKSFRSDREDRSDFAELVFTWVALLIRRYTLSQ